MNRSGIFLASGLVATPVVAQDVVDESGPGSLIDGVSIKGHARVYDYRHWHSDNRPYPTQIPDDRHDTSGGAIGGDVIVESGSWRGFTGGLSRYTQQKLIAYDNENSSLAPHVTHLGEAYFRHQSSLSRITVGRQLIDTPFANGDMYAMLPRSFQGISGTLAFGGADVIQRKKNRASPFELDVLAPLADDAKRGAPEGQALRRANDTVRKPFRQRLQRREPLQLGLHQANPLVPIATPGLFTACVQYAQGLAAGDVSSISTSRISAPPTPERFTRLTRGSRPG